jgi:hypothetical protein
MCLKLHSTEICEGPSNGVLMSSALFCFCGAKIKTVKRQFLVTTSLELQSPTSQKKFAHDVGGPTIRT